MTDNPPAEKAAATGSRIVRCWKHYCRKCGAEHYIKIPSEEFPMCCGKRMAFLGQVDAFPGRDESNCKA